MGNELIRQFSLLSGTLLGLGGCMGGGSDAETGETVQAATNNFIGNPSADFTYDPSANTVSARDTLGTVIVLDEATRVSISVPDNFTAFSTTGENSFAFRGVSPSGEGVTQAYYLGTLGFREGASSQRLAETTLPGSGSVTYNGDYAGIYAAFIPDGLSFTITGDVELVADFSTGNISGDITNRVATATENSAAFFMVGETISANDITLEMTELSGGRFRGVATGGSIPLNQATSRWGTQDGEYGGLIVGPGGTEGVGNLVTLHTDTGSRVVILGAEVGSFVVTE